MLDDTAYLDLLRRDAFLAFRFLCRMAMKVDKVPTKEGKPEAADDLSPMVLKQRALGLEMILSLLTNPGPVIQTQEPFLSLIKQSVTLAISKNGLLIVPALFELALSLFLILLKNYKVFLKSEIEVLFNEIYLYVLDNPNAMFKQKFMVLQGLFKICSNSQTLVDIYVNYDCDLSMASIYEKFVTSLSRIAQGSGIKVTIGGSGSNSKSVGVFGVAEDATTDASIVQERKLRSKALRCLVAIVMSLSEWMRESPNGNGTSVVADMLLKVQEKVPTPPESNRASSEVVPSADKDSDSSVQCSVEPSPVSDDDPRSPRITNGDAKSGPNIGPVIVPKNPLHSVSMADGGMRKSKSVASLTEAEPVVIAPEAPEDFQKMKMKKQILRQGITKFNDSPNKGIAFLRENGFLTDDASVIQFLRQNPELNKRSIGDYIGDGKEDNIRMMHKFVDDFDFTGVDFVASLRRFLQSFRLPGEAQKIDRIMEAFAARFCSNNPQIFAKADVAYTLAFSIMMLNTDQHSTRIKHRMTLSDFLRNNRGINDNSDLPDEFLAAIFEDIAKNEIVLEEERTVKELERMTAVGVSSNAREMERQRRELFKRETKHIEKKSQSLMRRKDKTMVPFKSATHVDHARPMFELLWGPALAVFSVIFEECVADDYPLMEDRKLPLDPPMGETNIQILDLCLMGFNHSIKIAAMFRIETERDAFVSSLGRLTSLSDVSMMKAKNVAAAKTLIMIGHALGNFLEDSWRHVLKCISEMDKWQLISEGSQIGDVHEPPVPDSKGGHGAKALLSKAVDDVDPHSSLATDLKAFHARRPSLGKLTKELHSQMMVITVR
jgi:brefeldin A-inhibited guanine nucleotide-exchange protein